MHYYEQRVETEKETSLDDILEEVTSRGSRVYKARGRIGVPAGAISLKDFSFLPLAMFRVKIFEQEPGSFQGSRSLKAEDLVWANSVVISNSVLPRASVPFHLRP